MVHRIKPNLLRAAQALVSLNHRLLAFWPAIALLCALTGLLNGTIDEDWLGMARIALSSPSAFAVLLNIAASGDLNLGNYAQGQNESLFLAGQERQAQSR